MHSSLNSSSSQSKNIFRMKRTYQKMISQGLNGFASPNQDIMITKKYKLMHNTSSSTYYQPKSIEPDIEMSTTKNNNIPFSSHNTTYKRASKQIPERIRNEMEKYSYEKRKVEQSTLYCPCEYDYSCLNYY